MRQKRVKLLRKAFRESGKNIESDIKYERGQANAGQGRRNYQMLKKELRKS